MNATPPTAKALFLAAIRLPGRLAGHGGAAWTVAEFLLAPGRLGGHQNRPSDGMPGWMTLWRGWSQLQIMIAVTANLGRLGCGGS